MTCIAIDDEPLSLDILKDFISATPLLTLKSSFTNPLEAMIYLQSNPVDLIFLDIQMPEMNGMKLPAYLDREVRIVYTTAYEKHAVASYETEAVDYLLKPFSYERFLAAVAKAWRTLERKVPTNSPPKTKGKDYFFVRSNKKIIKIDLEDLHYIEGLKDYILFMTKGEKIISRESLRNIELLLVKYNSDFIRVHKSFIVSIKQMKGINGNQLHLLSGKEIPIGRTYKEELLKYIRKDTFGH